MLAGTSLASGTRSATPVPQSAPVPTSMLGECMTVADGALPGREAGLYSVFQTGIRFLLPESTVTGLAVVTLHRDGAKSQELAVRFSGVAAASAFRVSREGSHT